VRREEDVALAPEDNGLRLMLPQERLPFGIKLNVGPVVVEEIKLDALGAWTFHKAVVHVPVIRTNQLRIGMPRGVDDLDRRWLENGPNSFFLLRAAGFPVFAAKLVPCRRKPDLVGMGFLNDEPSEPLGMPTDDAESDRTAVVLNVQSEAGKADFAEKRLDDLGCLVKGVGELRRIGHVGVAKSRIVRGDDMKPVGERRYQIAILV